MFCVFSLGDMLVKITNNGSSLNMAAKLHEEGLTSSVEDSNSAELDVHFVYASEMYVVYVTPLQIIGDLYLKRC